MNKKKFFRIYESWTQETQLLTSEEKGRLIDELINFLVTGQEQLPEGNERFVYPLLVDRIRKEQETHERTEERRRATREMEK